MRRLEATEHDEQRTVIEWATAMSARWPELRLLYAIPNGGSRHPAEAARMKATGTKAGVPDLHLPVSRCGYHAMFIEMKSQHGKPSPAQRWWQRALSEQGHLAVTCWGADTAIQLIGKYMEGELQR